VKLSDRQAEYAASIAVIGRAGRFPGSANLTEFWHNLCAGREGIRFFTEEELLSAGADPELVRRPNYVKAMGVLENADLFDAHFFGYNPREAESIDPQQRVFLEVAWEALEDAGYATDEPGVIGVYASASISTYMQNLWRNAEVLGSSDVMQFLSGNDKDHVAMRVSYKFNLRGPSVCVQSACSSSLVAVHLACRSLLTYECDVAMAGGVSIGVPLKEGYLYEEGGIASPDGHCRAFDAKASGTVRGLGCGVVVLKRLFEAIKDGDAIHAIIRGSAINNDGSSKVGYTAPSVDSQADVIRAALAVARVPSETITYIEAHGTGTHLGDPIELKALSKAFRSNKKRESRCAIGSVKTNIGHLDAAAGIAGLIKAVLTLENKALPPSLNFETPNPKAGFEGSPFYVNAQLADWPVNGTPRRAGVSSLGIGGTNVHAVLEEAPELDRTASERGHHLLVFSAKTQRALEAMTIRLADHLEKHPGIQLADAAHTLQIGRKAFPWRRAIVCEGVADAVERLRQPNSEGVATARTELRNCPVVFMFPGGGTQYPGMGRELYRQERVFREHFDKCAELLKPIVGRDLRTLLHCGASEMDAAAAALVRPSLGLPAIFATEYALAQLFMSWGIQPKSMIGHSLGEYAAACIAGVFSLPDALALVSLRGKLFETLPAGAMLSVNLRERDVLALHLEDVAIAAINGPDNCVISGKVNAIEQASAVLEAKGIEFRRLHIDAASHSPMVQPIVDKLAFFLRQLELLPPRIPFISNLTGTWITPEQAVDPGYWTGHLLHTVRFADGISELLKETEIALVEIGPGHTLSTLARIQAREKSVPVISSMKHPHESAAETQVLYGSLGRLWTVGVQVDWKVQYSASEARRVSLPTYPFERSRYFVEPVAKGEAQSRTSRRKPDIADWFYAPSWKQIAGCRPFKAQQEAASWMVFTTGSELEQELIEALRKTNDDVNVVRAGAAASDFERPGEREFCIDPANSGHYDRLFTALPDSRPVHLVHCWSLVRNAPEFEHGFNSALFLAQAAGAVETGRQKNLWVVSNDLAQVSQQDLPDPEKAALLGICRTIPLEYPDLRCAVIDVGMPKRNPVSTLLECCANPPQSTFLAYRMGRLWRQSTEPLPLPPSGERIRVRENGVYLITGGLGQLGLALALHLARTAKARLVLLDVATLPAQADWEQILAAESTPPAMRFQLNALRSLEEQGAAFIVAQADVCDERQVRAAVAQALQTFGAIDGVVHAAGLPGGGIMQFKTPAEIEAVRAPKVKGARVLEHIFKETDLDFFVACGSVTSLQGEFAQVDNCSANALLDAFCLNNSFKASTLTAGIGWNAWASSAGQERNSAAALTAAEAGEVFDRILNLDASRLHILVSSVELDLESHATNSASRASKDSALPATPELYSRPELSSVFVEPRNETEGHIADVWKLVLGLKSIGVCDNFWELGGNSLLAAQVVSRIKEKFHIPLPLRAIFELPTVEKLAEKTESLKNECHAANASRPSETAEFYTTPIRRVDRNAKLALSYGQERLWFIAQLDPDNVAYNLPSAVRIDGPLDPQSLERTLQEVVRRHESLRTRFVTVDDEPRQVIDSSVTIELPIIDLGHFSGPQREVEARSFVWEEARRPFDLARGPLLRAKLLRLGDDDHLLVFSMHHIISDGWSIGVLVREVSEIYSSFVAGRPSPLPELPIQYADFSAWQRELSSGPALQKQLEYWKQKLAGVEPLMLPTDKPRSPMQRQPGATTRVKLSTELTEALNALGRKQCVTLYMTLLAAFQALLCRYAQQYDISVGTPVAGRSRSETEALIGNFINMLVLRNDLSGNPDSIALLQRVKETTLEAQAHQDVSFEKLVEALLSHRDLSRSPLFQVVFGLLNQPWTGLHLGEAKLLPFDVHTSAAQFEITLLLGETGLGLEGYIEYNTGLFEAATIERLADHYSRLLTGMASAPQLPILSLNILGAEERRMLLEDFNATAIPVPATTVVRLFEEQAERSPGATAVQYEEDSLSYAQLNCRANQLARRLRQLGVGPESRVGLLLERSFEMVVGILATLKAGAAYVPLDPDYPPERLNYMLESAQVKALLTQTRLRQHLPAFSNPVLVLDVEDEREKIAEQKAENLNTALLSEHAAYIIYTSGSTGRPKGVVNTHGGLLNRLLWMQEEYQLDATDVVLQKTPFSFDVSMWEFLWPLVTGAKLVVARPKGHQDPDYLAILISNQQITTLHFVPSMLAVFLDGGRPSQCASIRRVICSGEALPVELARQCLESMPWAELHNLYGPTEAAIDVTYWKCRANESRANVPIGKAISNIRLYVVSEEMQPTPLGVPGELCLAGVGLARGYWGRGDLTAERFIPDSLSGRSGERLYRTGDLARWLPDGQLEYLGRIDHQVKVRGFRIELGEIEAALQECAGVRQAVVIAQADQAGDKRLVAYVVSGQKDEAGGSSEKGPRVDQLREHLLGKLPEYMVPHIFVELESLPLNHNGKIDRKSLPQSEKEQPQQEYVEPRSQTETTLCRLWQEILRCERVGIHDNFFKLGGHSLLAAQLATRIRGSFHVDVPLREMFESPTVARLAGVIDRAAQTAGANAAPAPSRPAIQRMARKAALVHVDPVEAGVEVKLARTAQPEN
jgi:amino acid adenylation domain-containing protein